MQASLLQEDSKDIDVEDKDIMSLKDLWYQIDTTLPPVQPWIVSTKEHTGLQTYLKTMIHQVPTTMLIKSKKEKGGKREEARRLQLRKRRKTRGKRMRLLAG